MSPSQITKQLEFDFPYEPCDVYRTPLSGPDVEAPLYRAHGGCLGAKDE